MNTFKMQEISLILFYSQQKLSDLIFTFFAGRGYHGQTWHIRKVSLCAFEEMACYLLQTSTFNTEHFLPSIMSPWVICSPLASSGLEKFSRQTTCMPGRISEGVWDSVGVVELPADPEWDEVPTPELRDSDSIKESAKEITSSLHINLI